MRRRFLVATFLDEGGLAKAILPARKERLRIHDVYAPYPVHALDSLMGIGKTRLPLVTLVAGACGLVFALAFQFYGAVLDWPLNVGGKPDNSTLAFIPIAFELTVLFGALATVAAFFLRARLYPGRREILPAPGVTEHHFAVVLRRPETPALLRRAREIMESAGAASIEELEAEL